MGHSRNVPLHESEAKTGERQTEHEGRETDLQDYTGNWSLRLDLICQHIFYLFF